MKLFTLLAIIFIVLICSYLFCTSRENFNPNPPNPYIISWTAPIDNGGDPDNLAYDWKVCTDDSCTVPPIDSGSTKNTSATTDKLEWNTKYSFFVRPTNRFGPGPWTTSDITTGNGKLSTIAIASVFNSDGTIKTPVTVGISNVYVFASGSDYGTVEPGDITAYALVTVQRNGDVVLTQNLGLTNTGEFPTIWIQGDFASSSIPLFDFKAGDVVIADVSVWGSKVGILTEATQSYTVVQTTPGNVTGIGLSYPN